MCPSLQASDPAEGKAEWTPHSVGWEGCGGRALSPAGYLLNNLLTWQDVWQDKLNQAEVRKGQFGTLARKSLYFFLLNKDDIHSKRGKKQIKLLCGHKAHEAIALLQQCHFPLFLKVTKIGTLNGLVEDIFMSSPVNRFILKERKICEQFKRTSWALGWISEWWINPREVEQNRDKIWQKLRKAEWCAGMKWVQILPSLELKMLEPIFDLMWAEEMP